MANFGSEDVEELVTCPYDPHHKLRRCRLQAHLTKCKKQALEEKKSCPFNAQHQVAAEEFLHHLEVCPNRYVVDRKIIRYTEEGKLDLPESPDMVIVAENWENEMCQGPAPGYDPKSAQKKLIFKDTSGMLPSEKKRFYKSLHSENDEVLSEPEKETESDDTSTLKQLRQPKDIAEVMKFRSPEGQCQSLGLARGQPISSRRIAANFFGISKSQDHSPSPESLGLGMGRGFQFNKV